MKIAGHWYFYDGLKEYNNPGTGIRSIKDCMNPPARNFHRNYAVYVKDSIPLSDQ